MTTSTSTSTVPARDDHSGRAERASRAYRLGRLGTFVDHRVGELQRSYLAEEATGVAALARLRRGIGKEVGTLPDLWEHTLRGFPEESFRSPDATFGERAAYTAITLYALHQQSRADAMHRRGVGLGAAVAAIATRSPSAHGVRRRFEELGTAESLAEAAHHARGLITQLRGENIGLDYGRFAEDLYQIQFPTSLARVRLGWGRDYYAALSRADTSTTPSTTEPDEEP